MIDFNLVKKKPDIFELRAYLHQLVSSPFAFAENAKEFFSQKFPDAENKKPSSPDRINELAEDFFLEHISDDALLDAINTDEAKGLHLNPEYILYFKDKSLKDTPRKYRGIPELFTHVEEVSFDMGGLIVLGLFDTQISILCDSKGNQLSGLCDSLMLGTEGRVILQYSSSYFWEEFKYDGEELISVAVYSPGPHSYPNDFPYLFDRDIIREQFPPDKCPIFEWEKFEGISQKEAKDLLLRDKSSYRYLVSHYKNNKKLAAVAVKSSPLAFSLLSKRLQHDREFVLKLVAENENVYNFLSEKLKKDEDIVGLCFRSNPDILRNIAPVSNRQWIIDASRNGSFCFKYASAELKGDKELILELVKKDWRFLREISKDLLTDIDFISAAINSYNESITNDELIFDDDEDMRTWRDVRQTITISEVVKYLIGSKSIHVMKLIAPITDLKLIYYGLRYTEDDDMQAVLGYISGEVKESREFWLGAVTMNSSVLKYLPPNFKKDHEIGLAAVQHYGESIEFLDDEIKNDPEVFLEAIKQITNRRGACYPER